MNNLISRNRYEIITYLIRIILFEVFLFGLILVFDLDFSVLVVTIVLGYVFNFINVIPFRGIRDMKYTPKWINDALMEFNYKGKIGSEIKHKAFYDDVYRVNVSFLYGGNVSLARTKVLQLYPGFVFEDSSLSFASGFCGHGTYSTEGDRPDVGIYIVWILDPRDYFVLAHEVFHLTFRILGKKSVAYNRDSEEAYAYYHHYWLERIWHYLTKGEDPIIDTFEVQRVAEGVKRYGRV